jgi:hypothetical protein
MGYLGMNVASPQVTGVFSIQLQTTANVTEVVHSCSTGPDEQHALRLDFGATCCLLRVTVIGFGENSYRSRMRHEQKSDLLKRLLLNGR